MSFEIPGKIVEEYTVRKNRLGLVQFGDTCRPIFLDLVPDAHVGDYVRVHVGFATERVSAELAQRAIEQLEHEQLNGNGTLRNVERALEADEALPETVRRSKPR
ncbi:MAG: HypC/HybG/HupF family hydrogenase formation chaperone [Bryobacteraceae bacterium]|jgi:hydrogenase expression/formation protein HypC